MPPWLGISVCLPYRSTKSEGVKKCVLSHPDAKIIIYTYSVHTLPNYDSIKAKIVI